MKDSHVENTEDNDSYMVYISKSHVHVSGIIGFVESKIFGVV